MRLLVPLVLATALAVLVAAPTAGARMAPGMVVEPLDAARDEPACLAECLGKRLEAETPGSAAGVWCRYAGGARWGCLSLLVDRSGRPTCAQLVVAPGGHVVESRPSACPIRLQQPMTVHTK